MTTIRMFTSNGFLFCMETCLYGFGSRGKAAIDASRADHLTSQGKFISQRWKSRNAKNTIHFWLARSHSLQERVAQRVNWTGVLSHHHVLLLERQLVSFTYDLDPLRAADSR